MTPLALGLDAETVLPFAFVVQIAVLVLLGTTLAYWTCLDATDRGSDSAAAWGVAVALFTRLAPVYLLYRRRIGARSSPMQRTERLVGTVCVASALALFVPLEVTPPDPLLNAYGAVVVFPSGLAVGYLLVARGGYARLRRAVGRSDRPADRRSTVCLSNASGERRDTRAWSSANRRSYSDRSRRST